MSNTCYICGKPIDDGRFYCKDCTLRLLRGVGITILPARQNGKSYLRYCIMKNLVSDCEAYGIFEDKEKENV